MRIGAFRWHRLHWESIKRSETRDATDCLREWRAWGSDADLRLVYRMNFHFPPLPNIPESTPCLTEEQSDSVLASASSVACNLEGFPSSSFHFSSKTRNSSKVCVTTGLRQLNGLLESLRFFKIYKTRTWLGEAVFLRFIMASSNISFGSIFTWMRRNSAWIFHFSLSNRYQQRQWKPKQCFQWEVATYKHRSHNYISKSILDANESPLISNLVEVAAVRRKLPIELPPPLRKRRGVPPCCKVLFIDLQKPTSSYPNTNCWDMSADERTTFGFYQQRKLVN